MSETVSASVPLNIRWTQELVDDGKGGSNFYMRLTPKIATGGRYTKGTSAVQVRNLLSVIQRLKREKSNEIQRAAKYGIEQGIKASDWDKERRQRELASMREMERNRQETEQMNQTFGPQISSSRFEQMMLEEAAKRGDKLNYAAEEKEEEKKEVEEIIYIK